MAKFGESKDEEAPLVVQIVLFLGAIGVMVYGMYYSITYPYPSGRPLDLAGFLGLWLREILILGTVLIGLLVVIAAWAIQLFYRIRERVKNAP